MKYILSLLMTIVTLSLSAQNLPERGEVRRGNKAYLKEEFGEAAERYGAAMAMSPESFEPRYNLGNALMKSEKVEEAGKLLKELAADSLLNDKDRAAAYYNLGNSQFQQQKLEEALESYKNAMRHDPTDQEAKYNYAYTKAMMEQNQNQDQQNQDQNQQDQDQNQEQDQQDQNQDQQEQGEDQQDQNQDQQDQQDQGDQGEEEQQEGEPQPQDGEISEQELDQMLDAIQAQEDKTQDDLKERARGVVVPGAKNW